MEGEKKRNGKKYMHLYLKLLHTEFVHWIGDILDFFFLFLRCSLFQRFKLADTLDMVRQCVRLHIVYYHGSWTGVREVGDVDRRKKGTWMFTELKHHASFT